MCHGIEVSRVTICESIPEKSFCPLVGTQWRPWWNLGLYCLPKYTIRSYRYTRHKISHTAQTNNNVVCLTSKCSDLPAHTRSLIRDFASFNILWVFKLLTKHHLERKLKRWLHRLVAFTPHWWRQSYDTATARGRVNISCCKITSNPVWHNWGNKTALHFLQTAKGAQWLGGRVLDLRPRSCGSKLALCPRSLLSTWST